MTLSGSSEEIPCQSLDQTLFNRNERPGVQEEWTNRERLLKIVSQFCKMKKILWMDSGFCIACVSVHATDLYT